MFGMRIRMRRMSMFMSPWKFPGGRNGKFHGVCECQILPISGGAVGFFPMHISIDFSWISKYNVLSSTYRKTKLYDEKKYSVHCLFQVVCVKAFTALAGLPNSFVTTPRRNRVVINSPSPDKHYLARAIRRSEGNANSKHAELPSNRSPSLTARPMVTCLRHFSNPLRSPQGATVGHFKPPRGVVRMCLV
jgi:hypothetical protein